MPVMAPQPQQSPPPTNQDSPAMAHMRDGSATYQDYQDYNKEQDLRNNPTTPPSNGGSPNMSPSPAGAQQQGAPDQSQLSPQVQQLQQTLDSLPDEQKNMIAQYLTPETIKVLNIVSGPDVANYLNQYVNPNKVLVPVPRDLAQKYLQQMQQGAGGQDQQQGQPQGQPQAQGQQPPPRQAQAAPAMKPQVQAQQPAPSLPNGVTPAPMQGGVMAPRA